MAYRDGRDGSIWVYCSDWLSHTLTSVAAVHTAIRNSAELSHPSVEAPPRTPVPALTIHAWLLEPRCHGDGAQLPRLPAQRRAILSEPNHDQSSLPRISPWDGRLLRRRKPGRSIR